MENKKLGLILVIVGLVFISTIFLIKYKEDSVVNKVIDENNSCFLDDGTCLHEDRNLYFYIFGGVIASVVIALGFY
jgi:hypothetical protein